MNPDLIIYLNGEYVKKADAKVSVFDHGLLYGDGIFAGLRIYNGRVFALDAHVRRFLDNARALMMDVPYTPDEIKEIVCETSRRNGLHEGYIRLVATRGEGDLGLNPQKCPRPCLFCIASTIALYSPEKYKSGLSLVTSQQRRNNATILDPQIKSLNYLNNILAKIEANHAGADDALMLSQSGIVTEGSANNVFIVRDGEIFTPPIYTGTLNGITRLTVMKLAREAGYPVFEREFTLFNVYSADECFLTGTGTECIAVTSVDKRVIGSGVAGPITERLLDIFQKHVRSVGTAL